MLDYILDSDKLKVWVTKFNLLTDKVNELDSTVEDLVTSIPNTYLKKSGDTVTGNFIIEGYGSVSSPETSANSNEIITAEWGNSKYLSLNGGTIVNDFNIKVPSLNLSTTPETNEHNNIISIKDSSDSIIGTIEVNNLSTGDKQLQISLLNGNNPYFGLVSNGSVSYSYTVTPPEESNENQIPTANWVNTKLSKYLPLNGGTITGTIVQNEGTSHPVLQNTDGCEVWLFSSEDDFYKGGFVLRAKDTENFCDLFGKNDGSLVWNNKNIVRSVGGVNADAAGNVNAPYLPLTGGELTGTTIRLGGSTGYDITSVQTENGHALLLYRNTNNGSYLWLRDNEDTLAPGTFDLSARNGDSVSALVGYPDGRLIWKEQYVVRTINGIGADANGNVAFQYNDGSAQTYIGNGSAGFVTPYKCIVTGCLAGGNSQGFLFSKNGTGFMLCYNPDQGYGAIRMPFAFAAPAGVTLTCSGNAWQEVWLTAI